jgi:hypothetical protein
MILLISIKTTMACIGLGIMAIFCIAWIIVEIGKIREPEDGTVITYDDDELSEFDPEAIYEAEYLEHKK